MDHFPPEIKGYTPVCLCGKGAYGQVWLVVDAVGSYRALKLVSKSTLGGDWEREFKGLQNYQTKVKPHPNLIQVFHIEDCGSFFYYTMEAADNLGNEENYIPSTLENWVREWGALGKDSVIPTFDGLLDGLAHLHEAGLIHRDIKPDNIVFVENVPKLSDIGLVSSVSQTLSLAGTQAYVPPEILTGEEKDLTPALDYYALGKTLYRAFSGQQPDDFPVVPHKILTAPGGKHLNILVKRACHPTPFCRLRTGEEFRAALHGQLGLRYDIMYFLAVSLKIALYPLQKLRLGARFVWRNPWARITAILLLIFWIAMSCFAYQRVKFMARGHHADESGFSPLLFGKAMWQTLIFNIPALPKYDLYDIHEKTDALVKKYGSQYLVSRTEYLKHKYPGVKGAMDVTLSFGGDDLQIDAQHSIPYPGPTFSPLTLDRMRQYVKQKEGVNNDIWQVPSGTQWTVENGKRTLELPLGKGHIELAKSELPLFYEINGSFLLKEFKGTFELVITAADYLEFQSNRKQGQPETRQLIRIPMQCDGNKLTFEKMYFRKQDGDDERPGILGSPRFPSYSLTDEAVLIQIVTVSDCIRVYLNGRLLYFTSVPFYGGKLSLNYDAKGKKKLMLDGFSVYDIQHANDKKLPEDRQYKLPTFHSTGSKARTSFERLVKFEERNLKRVIDTPEWVGGSTGPNTRLDPLGYFLRIDRVLTLQRCSVLKDEEVIEFDVVLKNKENLVTVRLREVTQSENGEVELTGRYWNVKAYKGFFEEEVKGLQHEKKENISYDLGSKLRMKVRKTKHGIYVTAQTNPGFMFNNTLEIDKNSKWVFTLIAYGKIPMELEFIHQKPAYYSIQ